MYRLIIESLLGLKLEANKLCFAPCLPSDWKSFKVHYRFRETMYQIDVLQTCALSGGMTVTLDGIDQENEAIPLVDDRRMHSVEVKISATFYPHKTTPFEDSLLAPQVRP
jgi:cellobiose phosphorylase